MVKSPTRFNMAKMTDLVRVDREVGVEEKQRKRLPSKVL